MRGFVDLHCHWLANIDDGPRAPEAGVALLRGLKRAGFDLVLATPHMRPGMFDHDRTALEAAFDAMRPHVEAGGDLPRVALSSEHFFDDVVFDRLVRGQALPYPDVGIEDRAPRGTTQRPRTAPKRSVLVELPPHAFPAKPASRFFDLGRAALRPVLAHPERYQPVWRDDTCLDPLLDAGAYLLLDVCALIGKYGRAAQRAAEKLLGDEAYEAACSDAHRPEDAEATARAIDVLERAVGPKETERLLRSGPRAILGIPEGQA